MKILIVILILTVIALLVFARYRRQIMTAIQIWRMFRQMNAGTRQTSEERGSRKTKGELKDTPLLRCEKCGKWVPGEGTVNLGNKNYCSTACLERAARIQSLVD